MYMYTYVYKCVFVRVLVKYASYDEVWDCEETRVLLQFFSKTLQHRILHEKQLP